MILCTKCGAPVDAKPNYEVTAAAEHARAAGHPPAPVTRNQPSPREETGHSRQPSDRSAYIGIGIGSALLLLVIVIVAASSRTDPEDYNDRQNCEANASKSDTIGFDDCQNLYPGQRGLSGWD